MKINTFTFILGCLASQMLAQTDSLPTPSPENTLEKIANSRRGLLAAFLAEDPAMAGLWMDSLARLEDAAYAGLIWDERWLLYYWTESYGTLLEEVSRFDETQRAIQSWKTQPRSDSLFEWIDFVLNEKQFDYFSSIRRAFLNEEEKVFSVLLLEYLLRLNKDEEEWAERLGAFQARFPQSQYLGFIRSIKPNILKPTNSAFGLSAGLMVGQLNGTIERTLHQPYAFGFDLYYWKKRWSILFDGWTGGPRLNREIMAKGDTWGKNAPTRFFCLGLGVGYDVINNSKIRLFPHIGGGWSRLAPPLPDDEEEPLPPFYNNFIFNSFYGNVGITADIKLFKKNYRDWDAPKGSYHGIRLKTGWNYLNLGKRQEQLAGEMLYFSVHYNLFTIIAQK